MKDPYLKTVQVDNLPKYFDKIRELKSNDTMLNALFFLIEEEEFQVFIKFNEIDLLKNLEDYTTDKTINHTYSSSIEKFYICYQPVFKISEQEQEIESLSPQVESQTALPMLNRYPMYTYANFSRNSYTRFEDFQVFLERHPLVYASNQGTPYVYLVKDVDDPREFTLRDYYNSFTRFYAVDVLPPTPVKAPANEPAVFWLARDKTQLIINLFFLVSTLIGIFGGWLIPSNILLVSAIFSILGFLIYNVWVSDYLNRDRGLTREAFNEKYGA